MKNLIYLSLFFLIPFCGVTQTFADKEYYLIDSLVLEELTESDKEILNHFLKQYHNAKTDTGRISVLNRICVKMVHNSWKRYQFLQYKLIKKSIATHPSKPIAKFLNKSLASALNNIGLIYKEQGNLPLALKYYQKGLKIHEALENKEEMTVCYNNIGLVHEKQGNIPLALEYFHKSLKLNEQIKDTVGMAYSYQNIANIHIDNLIDYDLALEYSQKSLELRKKIGDKLGMSQSYHNIASIYQDKESNYTLALDYLHKSLNISKQLGHKSNMAYSYQNIGNIYKAQRNLSLALEYFRKSLKLRQQVGDKSGIANSYNNISGIMLKSGKIQEAQNYAIQSLALAQEIGSPLIIKESSRLLGNIYEKQGKGIQALKMYKLHIQMRDSINNTENQKASVKQQVKYEYEKQKAIDDAEHDKLLAIEQEKKEKQQILTIATAVGLVLVVVFLIFIFNRLRITKKQNLIIEKQKQKVEQQKEIVEVAHRELEEKNQEITDSITYAKRIQSAILPSDKIVKEYLQESFVLYKPKDIVAGDFYWMKHKDNKVLFAVADCTGHGVPGAMVSVVCNNGLNRSLREYELTDPAEILNKTREIVLEEFEKSEENVSDGMDIALCSLEGNTLKYAGANNPLWIIRKGELLETKANKQPIGKCDNPKPYTTHTFALQKGDSIYIFSDGYADQFGGEKGKKLKAANFKKLLLSIQNQSIEKQKGLLNDAFKNWKGELEQLDDVCVIGVSYL